MSITRRFAPSGVRHQCRSRRPHSGGDSGGYTLIELILVIGIIPLVIGAISVAIISVITQRPVVVSRIGQSNDAALVSASYVRDVQSSGQVTTDPSLMACGTATSGTTQLLGIEWNAGTSSQTSVSYVDIAEPGGSTTTYELFRRQCNNVGTVLQKRLIASDLPSTQGPATIACASTITSCSATTGWVSAAGVSSVSLAVEAPGSAGGYLYSLDAIPSAWTPASGGAFSGGSVITPFIVLPPTGSSCPNAPGQSAPVVISGAAKVISGSGSAPIEDGCPSASTITLAGSGSVSASEVESADCPTPNSVTQSGSPAGPHEVCTPVTNPLAALASLAPSNPTAAPTSGCTSSGTTYTCPTGEYASQPSWSGVNTASVTIGTGAAGSVFIFDQAMTIHNSQIVTFEPGTYWFKGGLSIIGSTTVVMDNGTYLFGTSSTPAATDTISVSAGGSLTTGAGGVLLYLEGGSANFSGGGSTSVLGESQFYGVAIWDAVNSGSSVTIANGASTTAAFGGVYVPYGETVVSGNGQVQMSFVATQTADFSASGTLTLG